ncbi:MAG: hypothetical protein KatS3mg026_0160 [Bacteroidia bacterium]|nr:MAG: hypothetical protein KatS3mg026_0160 [Bacteroidia bacterium]
MKYRLTRARSGWIIEGERVHYAGGLLAEAWEGLFSAAGLIGREWGPVLLIGMGASLMDLLHRTAARCPPRVEIIEIDPEMVALQEAYFSLPLPYRVHLGDAADVLPLLEGKFSAVFVDAFVEDTVPLHLQTPSFIEALGGALETAGLLFWNVLRPAEAQRVGQLLSQRFPVVRRWRYDAHVFWGAAWVPSAFPLPI